MHSYGKTEQSKVSAVVKKFDVAQYENTETLNINRPKITAVLSIKLSIDMGWLVLTETVYYKRLLLQYVNLGEDEK